MPRTTTTDARYTRAAIVTALTFFLTTTAPLAKPELGPVVRSQVRDFTSGIDESVPAEFAADLLIRAAMSRRADREDEGWRLSVFERAFLLANKAQEPRRRRAFPWIHDKTIEGVTTRGRARGLDKTSLQTRAINGLVAIEPGRAIELLMLVPTTVPRIECTDTMVYDAEPSYEVIGALIRSLQAPPLNLRHTDDERLARDLLQSRIAGIETSAELAPAIAAVLMVNLPAQQIDAVITTLGDRLRSIHDDDWTFTANLLQTWDAVHRFVDVFATTRRVAMASFVGSFRAYLVTHLETRRCSLSGHDIGAILDIEQVVIAQANTMFAAHNQPLLHRGDVQGSHTIPSVRPTELWRSLRGSSVWGALDALGLIEMSANRLAPERRIARATLARELVDWTVADEGSLRLYFHQRCLALIAVARLDDFLRADALDELAVFLTRYAGSVRPVEWIAHVSAVLDPPDANAVMRRYAQRAFQKSGNPVLTRYARLDALLN